MGERKREIKKEREKKRERDKEMKRELKKTNKSFQSLWLIWRVDFGGTLMKREVVN